MLRPFLAEWPGWTDRKVRRSSPVGIVSMVYNVFQAAAIFKKKAVCLKTQTNKDVKRFELSKSSAKKRSRVCCSKNVSDQVCPTRIRHKSKMFQLVSSKKRRKRKVERQIDERRKELGLQVRYLMH